MCKLSECDIRSSIVVSIPACHAGDRGSIPRFGVFFFFFFFVFFVFVFVFVLLRSLLLMLFVFVVFSFKKVKFLRGRLFCCFLLGPV